MTILGLLGVALGEITWGSQAVSIVAKDQAARYAVMALMMFFVFAYIGYGGQASSFRTDQLQLVFSYTGIFSLLGLLFLRLSHEHISLSIQTRWSAVLAAVYPIIIVVARRGKVLVRTDRINTFNAITTGASNALITLSFIGVVLVSLFLLPPRSSVGPLVKLEGFGNCYERNIDDSAAARVAIRRHDQLAAIAGPSG